MMKSTRYPVAPDNEHGRLLLSCMLGMFIAVTAQAVTIDLNDFTATPGSAVTIAADGSSTAIAEAPILPFVTLTNNPGTGSPNVIVVDPNMALFVDFNFVQVADADAEFGIFVIDTDGHALQAFFTQMSGVGTTSFDLSGLVD